MRLKAVGTEFFGFAVTFSAAVPAVVGRRNGRDVRRPVEAIREDGRRPGPETPGCGPGPAGRKGGGP